MKLLPVLLIFLPLFYARNLEICDIRCTTSEKNSTEVIRCEHHDRYVTFENKLLRVLNTLKIKVDIFNIKEGKLVRIFKFAPIDWCELNDGKAKLMSFQKLIVQGIRKTAPAFFHKCPYEKHVTIENGTLSNDVIAIFPLGVYRILTTAMDNVDSKIFMLNITFSISESRRGQ